MTSSSAPSSSTTDARMTRATRAGEPGRPAARRHWAADRTCGQDSTTASGAVGRVARRSASLTRRARRAAANRCSCSTTRDRRDAEMVDVHLGLLLEGITLMPVWSIVNADAPLGLARGLGPCRPFGRHRGLGAALASPSPQVVRQDGPSLRLSPGRRRSAATVPGRNRPRCCRPSRSGGCPPRPL